MNSIEQEFQPDEQQSTAEQEFLKDSPKCFIISLGMKRQGKTYLTIKYMRWAIQNNIFEEYHVILPQFGHERDGAYQWMKGNKQIFIYDKYHQVVCDKILKIMQSKHIFFCIDDASGELLQNFDTSITKLLTCNEHGKTACVWFNIHSAKRVLPPIARQMLNYLFLYNVDDGLLLKGIWEERFSRIYRKYDEFLDVYDEAMRTDKNAVMYALSKKHDVVGIKDWDLLHMEFNDPQKNKQPAPQQQPQEKKMPMMSRTKESIANPRINNNSIKPIFSK